MDYKGFSIKRTADGTLYEISGIGKGSIPSSVRGLFTSTQMVKRAIDLLEFEQKSKRVKNATENAVVGDI